MDLHSKFFSSLNLALLRIASAFASNLLLICKRSNCIDIDINVTKLPCLRVSSCTRLACKGLKANVVPTLKSGGFSEQRLES